MKNDNNLIFENYFNKLNEVKATSSHGTPIYNRPTSAPDLGKGYDAIQNTINKKLAQKPGSTPKRAEDAETYGVEDKIKMYLHEVEGFGYTGDHLDCKEMAKLVVGSPVDWGDSYGHVVQALEHVLEAYYERGLQDS